MAAPSKGSAFALTGRLLHERRSKRVHNLLHERVRDEDLSYGSQRIHWNRHGALLLEAGHEVMGLDSDLFERCS